MMISQHHVRIFFALWALAALYGFLRLPGIDAAAAPTAAALAAAAVIAIPMSARLRLAVALLLGVAVRIAIHLSVRDTPLVNDQSAYVQLGLNLLDGRGFSADVPIYGTGLQAIYPPFYPLLLIAGHWLDGGYVLINTLFDVGASALIYRLTNASDRSAAAYFLFPATVLYSSMPQKEALAILVFLLCMVVLRRPILLGAAAALLALTQPAWAFIPLIAFALNGFTVKSAAIAASAWLIVMLPWWVRNALVLGHFIPLTTSAGLSLAVAANKGHVATAGLPLDEVGRSAYAAQRAMQVIASDLTAYLLYITKVAITNFLTVADCLVALSEAKPRWAGAAGLWAQASFVALIAAAARRFRSDRVLTLFAIAALLNCFVLIWMEFSSRHLAFIVPILIIGIGRRRHAGGADDAAASQVAV